MRSIWCVVFWGLIWSQLYTLCLMRPPATKCSIAHQETLQPKSTHLNMCPENVYPVHEHDKQRRKPARTPSPRQAHAKPTPTLRTFKVCKRTHAIFNNSSILAMLQDGTGNWQRGHALRKRYHRGQLRGPRHLQTSVQRNQSGGPKSERKTNPVSDCVPGECLIRTPIKAGIVLGKRRELHLPRKSHRKVLELQDPVGEFSSTKKKRAPSGTSDLRRHPRECALKTR